ncbi:MAG: hypothetical protein KF735_17550 [Chelatococcus sp.]|jgi:hypothetical protein|uniref:cucumopine synthase-related protein n=1 Tax=unclassified Chelatococcus TaxID=2638111 RepID=UPI001BCC7D0C|nr:MULTISPECIES: hypothetical protein [unclassified Chelatococcus]CAH1652416.1 Cucumopine_C domain-containing protein [Hyphomicrobiales bacterium]MBS7700208.1 hypothetical protein [Chelatococcus sp. YT9]MBS7739981.1 hypothetical protein [Chelatococcus sp. HY11]MBX3539452.1 hypothetical protein [Chelatococcus sp.]MBX3547010.1 hypothetical protein [Chelatococcus sp.]
MSTTLPATKTWQAVQAELEAEIDRIWLDEPLEIQKIRLGVIDTGAGSGGQSFSIMVHLEAFLMIFGANVFYRFVRLAKDQDDLTLDQLRVMTRAFLHKPFNVFEFMGDLALHDLHRLGNDYLAALDDLKTKDDYIALTGSMMTYVIRLHRWIHFHFPWNLGVAFPHRTVEELSAFAAAAKTGA